MTGVLSTPAEAAGSHLRYLYTIPSNGGVPYGASEDMISDNLRKTVYLGYPKGRPAQIRGYVRNLRRGKTREISRNNQGDRLTQVSQVGLAPDDRSVYFTGTGRNLVTGEPTPRRPYTYLRSLRTGRVTMVGMQEGRLPDGFVDDPAFSADMSRVVFASGASNLVPEDTNGRADIFVQDLRTGRIELVSQSFRGGPTNGGCSDPDISDNGVRVVYECAASNLARRDTNRRPDIFFTNLRTGRTVRVSQRGGRQANGMNTQARISPDGRKVAFYTLASNLVGGRRGDSKVAVHNLRTNTWRKPAVGQQTNWLDPDFTHTIHELVVGVDMQVYYTRLNGRQRRLLSHNRSGQPARNGAFFLGFTRDGDHALIVSNARNLGRRVPPGDFNVYLRRVG
jgi:hypothetical protein